jgi:hypothetical protein
MIYIYNLKKDGALEDVLNYAMSEFKPNWYSKWRKGLFVSSEYFYDPIVENDKVRNKTREEQILSGKTYLLKEGEYVDIDNNKVAYLPRPSSYYDWDIETHTWILNQEKVDNEYKDLITKYKTQAMELGFDFQGHNQRCRDKDIANLGLTLIQANRSVTTKVNYSKRWQFTDNDIVELSASDIMNLGEYMDIFTEAVFNTEAMFKFQEIDLSLTFKSFIDNVNAISTVKAWEVING